MTAKRILILYAEAGFGHRSAARAVAAALQELYPAGPDSPAQEGCQVEMIDPMQDKRAPAILRRGAADYDRVVRLLPDLYQTGYEVSDSAPSSMLVHNAMAALLFDVMDDLVQRLRPDAIVTPYLFYQSPLAAVYAIRRRDVPLLTVITDLPPVHQLWFHKAADLCLVSAPEARQQALEAGLEPDRVVVTGIPVHPDLVHETRPPAAVRAELGWPAELKNVLVVGSKRVKDLTGIVRALNHAGLPIQLTVVAGGDDALFQQLRQTEWHLPAHVYNFVDNMPALMRSADCIICKAGGLITTESLACGLPILLTDAIPGQEASNVRYVVEGGAGAVAADPLEGLETMSHWLANGGEELAQVSANSQRLGRPRAAFDVAELAWKAALRGPQPRPERNIPEELQKLVERLQQATGSLADKAEALRAALRENARLQPAGHGQRSDRCSVHTDGCA